jgi:hypothetical protein
MVKQNLTWFIGRLRRMYDVEVCGGDEGSRR